MSDVVVTVPKRLWMEWLSEGDLALPLATPDKPSRWHGENEYGFVVRSRPKIEPGERVYVVAFNALRGYAPLVEVSTDVRRFGHDRGFALVRRGEAVPVTLATPIAGFQGFRYRWWSRSDERPFRDWAEVQP